MTKITIENKKYVLLPEKEYLVLQNKATHVSKPTRLLSVAEAKTFTKKLVHKWAAEK
ncbi:MAG: hypothetical protein NTW29_07215 [Bacteroidetes bacterium]|nr:hypothetical protein [Bacteroidota bacterium]